jgi:hypothetical protein
MTEMTRTDAPWIRAAKAWKRAKEASEKATIALEKARFRLTLLAGDASASGAGVSVTRYFRAGLVAYGSIPELQGVALDQFRKPGTWETRVTRDAGLPYAGLP